MSIATNNVIAKIAAVVAGLGLVAMSFAYAAPAAKADTASDMAAQIASLQAQLAALQGSSMSSPMFTKDLTIGSRGADVTALQNWLMSKSYAIPAGATGYFGTQTKAAVARYQVSMAITPAAGYFGPLTRAKVNASGDTSMGGGTTPSTGGITTKGAEGIINVEKETSGIKTSVYAGDAAPVLVYTI